MEGKFTETVVASIIETTWSRATVLVDSPSGRGTGFLVGRPLGGNIFAVILITNKHVLGESIEERRSPLPLKLGVNRDVNGVLVGHEIALTANGLSLSHIFDHPDPDVDVAGFRVDSAFLGVPDISFRFIDDGFFATAVTRAREDITAGEDVVVVGYPNAIRQGRTNLPLIRQGMIATRPGEELHEDIVLPDGQPGNRVSRGFLIDGGTISGSSGSPVVLKPVAGRMVRGNLLMGTSFPYLLGIVAESRLVHIDEGTSLGFAGLGLVYEAETIEEVVNLVMAGHTTLTLGSVGSTVYHPLQDVWSGGRRAPP